MSRLTNRLTEALRIQHPILSAPMAFAGGGALAAAVSLCLCCAPSLV